jgi:hypothetical protein
MEGETATHATRKIQTTGASIHISPSVLPYNENSRSKLSGQLPGFARPDSRWRLSPMGMDASTVCEKEKQ